MPKPFCMEMENSSKIIAIVGATASGKTAVAAHLAAMLGGEVISADSRQVYCGMDIGTGKDLDEYCVNGSKVPYHLIDIAPAGSQYTLYDYCRDFRAAHDGIMCRGKLPILCGGSGLYVEAALRGYSLPLVPADHALRERLGQKSVEELQQMLVQCGVHAFKDNANRRRMVRAIEVAQSDAPTCSNPQRALPAVCFCITYDREERRRRIAIRLQQRLDAGMVEEVHGLLERGISPQILCGYGLEYKYITMYLLGEISHVQMHERLLIAIHQFAKRQVTWFGGMQRRGTTMHYIEGNMPLEEKLQVIANTYNGE